MAHAIVRAVDRFGIPFAAPVQPEAEEGALCANSVTIERNTALSDRLQLDAPE
jgi:hypothetical protein